LKSPRWSGSLLCSSLESPLT